MAEGQRPGLESRITENQAGINLLRTRILGFLAATSVADTEVFEDRPDFSVWRWDSRWDLDEVEVLDSISGEVITGEGVVGIHISIGTILSDNIMVEMGPVVAKDVLQNTGGAM